jgi:trans-aconitate 2-methyltransferase
VVADVWEMTCLHVPSGEDAVLEWAEGTAPRPGFVLLDGAERDTFVAEYAARLRTAYPRRDFGTLLPFRRIFAVGRRESRGTG